ncbi:hypothetical protein E2562_003685 [Oryza meyeriana var. granulata]|uniref:Uncharacterized protein n=1 Tax=Oryza meyeriana var. granulata TaxID=110450 RepID=A0A6G1C450_9ORYZ|nr:hypothetical protein E2562_003685 [Oryza meyeriana var. granulata]
MDSATQTLKDDGSGDLGYGGPATQSEAVLESAPADPHELEWRRLSPSVVRSSTPQPPFLQVQLRGLSGSLQRRRCTPRPPEREKVNRSFLAPRWCGPPPAVHTSPTPRHEMR